MSSSAHLDELQRALEVIYGVRAPASVDRFVLDAEAATRLGVTIRADEELYVVEHDGEMELALYLSPKILERLPSLGIGGARGFLERHLPSFTTAAEGVSHFVYLTLEAMRERTVSLLELEVQAEIDKFATAVLHLWKHGAKELSGELRQRLFTNVGYRDDLSGEERDRYGHANRLVRDYAASLERRFVIPGQLEGLLRELRRVYRIRGTPKYEYLAQHI